MSRNHRKQTPLAQKQRSHASPYRTRRRMLHKRECKTRITYVFELNHSQSSLRCQATAGLPTHTPGPFNLVSPSKWVTPQRRA